jgi:hypothetical protein
VFRRFVENLFHLFPRGFAIIVFVNLFDHFKFIWSDSSI